MIVRHVKSREFSAGRVEGDAVYRGLWESRQMGKKNEIYKEKRFETEIRKADLISLLEDFLGAFLQFVCYTRQRIINNWKWLDTKKVSEMEIKE